MSGVHLDHARAPDGMRLYAIGDVHGRLDLLAAMHERIEADLRAAPPCDWRIIHLGDYVDRGPASKGVLDFLLAAQRRDRRVLTLAGNHDYGFLEFLRHPDAAGLFAHFGGVDTARSYGVALDFERPWRLREGHAALVRAVPPEHVDFLLGLPYSAGFGDFFFCHAGIRPRVPLAAQTHDDLVWIREDFLDWPDPHPAVVVHGHTPCPAPELRPNRVNLDTHAFRSGLLSALRVEGAEKRLVFARDERSGTPIGTWDQRVLKATP